MVDAAAATDQRLAVLAAETRAGFAWLTAGLDPAEPVSFIPNPGNVGDAAINLACWRHLAATFAEVEICPAARQPQHRQVFLGGGGNFVEPLWQNQQALLERLSPARHRLAFFPATLYGYGGLLRRWRGRLRAVCREAVSFGYAAEQLEPADVCLGHDAAFALHGTRPFAAAPPPVPGAPTARFLRRDKEGVLLGAASDGDLTGSPASQWLEPTKAAAAVAAVAERLAHCGSVATDRLHTAILAALLGRPTSLNPNSYFKNRAVFEQSLARLPWVAFDASNARRPSDAGNDPLIYRSAIARRRAAQPFPRRLWRSVGNALRG